ncbi:MAG: homoserine kinase [Candidatus Aminicenantes bacterium]
MKEIIIRAPATIANFGPGFDIFALALKEPHDVLKLRLNNTNSINIRITGRPEPLPTEAEKNTAGLAAIHFFKKVRLAAGVDVEIRKKIISGAGLGTSGASAAACVYGLNKLLKSHLNPEEMIDIARKGEKVTGKAAHADNVAGCLLGGFVLIKNYSPLDVVKMKVPSIPIVVCAIKKSQQTTRGLIPSRLSLAKTTEQMSYCSSLIHALLAGDLKSIGEAVNRDCISEPVRSSFISGYDDIKNKVLEAGAYGFNVSGGGSSLFAICEKNKTSRVAQLMKTFCNQRRIGSEIIITQSSNKGVAQINEL